MFTLKRRLLAGFLTACLCEPLGFGQSNSIKARNWGSVVSPVFGSNEELSRPGVELFAGPNKFGSYFSGVLPNGRIVKPAGISIQVGMRPLGAAVTPDGRFLVTSNDNERQAPASQQNPTNLGGYSLSVIDTADMKVVSQINARGRFYLGLQITGTGPYTVWASGGGDNQISLFTISPAGSIAPGNPSRIALKPILPSNAGYVSNYTPGAALDAADSAGNKPPVPVNFDRRAGAQIHSCPKSDL
jgi:hypothetical protein